MGKKLIFIINSICSCRMFATCVLLRVSATRPPQDYRCASRNLTNENLALLTLIEYSSNYYDNNDEDVLNVVNDVFNTSFNENYLDVIDEAIYLEQNEDFKIDRTNLTFENLADQVNEYNYKDVKFREF